MAKLERVRPEDPVTDDVWNSLADKLEPWTRFSVAQGCGLELTTGPHGKLLSLRVPQEIPARLSGASSPYSWTALSVASSGAYADRTAGLTGGTSNAYEINGKSGLNGRNVLLSWTAAGDWRFQWVGYGCNITFVLKGCNSCNVVGANVDFVLGGSTVFSGTTNSLGTIVYPNATGGNYSINWSVPGTTYSGSESLSACATTFLTKTITPAGSDICITNCAVPVPPIPTLFVTDNLGTRNVGACFPVGTPGAETQSYKTQVGSAGTCTSPIWQVTLFFAGSTLPGFACSNPPISSTAVSNVATNCNRPISISGTYGSTTPGTPLNGTPFLIHE